MKQARWFVAGKALIVPVVLLDARDLLFKPDPEDLPFAEAWVQIGQQVR